MSRQLDKEYKRYRAIFGYRKYQKKTITSWVMSKDEFKTAKETLNDLEGRRLNQSLTDASIKRLIKMNHNEVTSELISLMADSMGMEYADFLRLWMTSGLEARKKLIHQYIESTGDRESYETSDDFLDEMFGDIMEDSE